MSVRGEVNSQPRQRGTLLPSRPGDEGIGAFEIVLAFTVFMICFIPLLKMIPTGSGIIAYSANQRLATSVLNNTLQNAQTSTVPETDYTTPRTWAAISSGVPWATETQQQQGGVTFRVYSVDGWCATDTTPGNGVLTSSEQASYHAVVKVEWGSNVSAFANQSVVVDSTELSTLTNAPSDGTTISSCPLGLT